MKIRSSALGRWRDEGGGEVKLPPVGGEEPGDGRDVFGKQSKFAS